MGFEPDFAPKITTVWGHLHGKLRAGVADGHMQFRNKSLISQSLLDDFSGPFRHLSGNSHVKRVGWSALGFGSIHTFYDIGWQVPKSKVVCFLGECEAILKRQPTAGVAVSC
jgi:hypothetical protein